MGGLTEGADTFKPLAVGGGAQTATLFGDCNLRAGVRRRERTDTFYREGLIQVDFEVLGGVRI